MTIISRCRADDTCPVSQSLVAEGLLKDTVPTELEPLSTEYHSFTNPVMP